MKEIAVIFFSFMAINSGAQTLSPHVESSAGDYFASSQGSLSWTLGEVMVETYSQTQGFLTQGFHQPLTISITNVELVETKISTYPNPVHDFVHIKITQLGDYHITLFSLQGIKLADVMATITDENDEHILDLKDYAATLYLLQITHTTTGKNFSYRILKY